jgi:hypothetical protein
VKLLKIKPLYERKPFYRENYPEADPALNIAYAKIRLLWRVVAFTLTISGTTFGVMAWAIKFFLPLILKGMVAK